MYQVVYKNGIELKNIKLSRVINDIRPALPGDVPRGYAVFWHNLFNLCTFRPWQYRRIWREMPLFQIGPTSRNTRSIVHLSEPGLKTGTRAVTVRHRAKRRRGRNHLTASGRSALFCRKKPEIRWVSRLNHRIYM